MTSISSVSTSGASMFTPNSIGRNSAADVSQFEQILKNFKEVASQTPGERAASAVLKKHGLTRDQLERLPSAQRDAIMKEMEDAVKRVVNANGDRQKRVIGVA
jgi:hypothetical protein